MARDPLRVFVVLLIVVSISRIHQHFPAIAQLRPALLATALVGVYAVLNPRLLASGSILQSWPARLIAALFIWACLSVPFGINMGSSGLFVLSTYVKTLVFAALVLLAIRNTRDLYSLSWALLISCGILAYLSLFVFQLSQYQGYARLDDMYTYDANDTGSVLTIGIGVALLHLKLSKVPGRIFSLAILVAMLAAIARTGSRGAFVGLAASTLAFLFLARGIPAVSRTLLVILGAGALAIGAPRGYWDQMKTILKPKEDYNYTAVDGRKQVAERGIGYMLSRPAFGLGINNFALAECTISSQARNYTPGMPLRCTQPHNSYVQAGAELGVPGLLIFTALMGSCVVGPILLRRRIPHRWRTGDAEERYLYHAASFLPVGAAGFAVSSAFLSFAWMDITYLLPVLVVGLYTATKVKLKMNAIFPPLPPERPKGAAWRTAGPRPGVGGAAKVGPESG